MTKTKRKPFEAYVCFVLLAVMTICMSMEIVSRYIFSSSFIWTEELTRYLFIWFVFISASYAVVEKAHIKADSFMVVIPKKMRASVIVVGTFIWLLVSLYISYIGIQYALTMIGAGSKSPALGVPIGIVYLGIPIGYLLMSFRLVIQIITGFNKNVVDTEE